MMTWQMAASMVAGVVILHYALEGIDSMSKDTSHMVRSAMILLAAGGFAQIVDLWLPDEVASGADVLLSVGIAALFIADRRCSVCPRAATVREGKRRKRDDKHTEGELT